MQQEFLLLVIFNLVEIIDKKKINSLEKIKFVIIFSNSNIFKNFRLIDDIQKGYVFFLKEILLS